MIRLGPMSSQAPLNREEGGRGIGLGDSIVRTQPAIAGLEDGGRAHKPRDACGFYKLEKEGNGFSLRAFRRNQPC